MAGREEDYETYRTEEEAKGNVPDPDWMWGDTEHQAWLKKRQGQVQGGMTKKEVRKKTFGEKGREVRGGILNRQRRLREAGRD